MHVSGVSFEREQRAAAELEEQRRKMLEKTDATAAAEPVKPVAETEPEAGAEAEPEGEADGE